MNFEILMIVGILVGNALSVVIPYVRKLAEGKISSFDYKYLKQSVISAVWQSLLSMQLWIDWKAPSGISWLLAFVLAITFGFGGKDFQAQIYKYIKREKITP